ncbi:hypothetical protein [Promicromonospora kroppenstedtii]|uniref:hypothetical protein n=1 Tax=Promicromonospora kroppenstedtii TaxID=440482 RepID=UPI0004AEB367|nr:hypothetical protein [Promicromonospora kroppenstedtii]
MDEFYETEEPAIGQTDPEAGVRRALDTLDGLDELPPAEHVARFEAVHDALRAHLSGDA